MIVYARLASTEEVMQYDVKDIRLCEFIKISLKEHIDNGSITYMCDSWHIILNNYDSYKDAFRDTGKHTYNPLAILNGKKLRYGIGHKLEQLGVK